MLKRFFNRFLILFLMFFCFFVLILLFSSLSVRVVRSNKVNPPGPKPGDVYCQRCGAGGWNRGMSLVYGGDSGLYAAWVWTGGSGCEPRCRRGDFECNECSPTAEISFISGSSCPGRATYSCQRVAERACGVGNCKGIFHKQLLDIERNGSYNFPNNYILDDVVVFGDPNLIPGWPATIPIISINDEGFFRGPSQILSRCSGVGCNGYPRDYGFIYIPSGWWSFGIKANNSTRPNACYYCPLGRNSCIDHNNYPEYKIEVCVAKCNCRHTDENCTPKYDTIQIGCDDCPDYAAELAYKSGDPNFCDRCKTACGGNVKFWLSSQGGTGNSPSDSLKPPLINYDSIPDEVISGFPELPDNNNDGSPDISARGLDNSEWYFTHEPFNVLKTGTGAGYDRYSFNKNIFVTEAVFVIPPGKTLQNVSVSAYEQLSCGPLNPHTNTRATKSAPDYVRFSCLEGPLNQTLGMSEIPLAFVHKDEADKIDGVECRVSHYTYKYPYGNIILPCSKVKITVGSFGGWLIKVTPTVFDGLYAFGGGVSFLEYVTRYFNFGANPFVSFNADLVDRNNNVFSGVDTVWSAPKYFEGGWYPVQTSAIWPTGSLFAPELWWRSCQNSNPSSCNVGEEYTEGSSLGGKLASCAPGSYDCACQPESTVGSLVSGETKSNVLIATLQSYGTPVNVVSEDESVLKVVSFSVNSANGEIRATLKAEEVQETKTVRINISAPAQDSSGDACGSTNVPCSVSIIVRPGRFWQAKNADVIVAQNIKSLVPSGSNFLLHLGGSNDTPGIPFYGANINVGEGSVSEKGWKANSNITGAYNQYNYSYFEKKAPSEVRTNWENKVAGLCESNCSINSLPPDSIFISKDGYLYYKVNVDLSINGNINIPSGRKYVIFVDGDLNINGNVSISNNFGRSFIMFVVKGKISVASNVTRVDGIYITDSSFSTGTRGPRQDSQLQVNGTVIANSFNLQRSLPVNQASNTPAELFEYKPSLILSMPYYFYQKNYNWREVNP